MVGGFYGRVWLVLVLCVNGCIQDTPCLPVYLHKSVSVLFFCIYVSVSWSAWVSGGRPHIPLPVLEHLFSGLLYIVSLVGEGMGIAEVNHFLLIYILEGFLEEGQNLKPPQGEKLDWEVQRGHYSATR